MNKKPLGGVFALFCLLVLLQGCEDLPSEQDQSWADPDAPLPHYHLEMRPGDLDWLYTRSIWSDERLEGWLSIHRLGLEDEPVGVRFRGSGTRVEDKKGFSFSLDRSFAGLSWGDDQISARASWRDPSFMREPLAMWLHREVDTLAPRTDYFKLFINNTFEGLYPLRRVRPL